MCEPMSKNNIIQLMGSEPKKSQRRTHLAIKKAFAQKGAKNNPGKK